MKFQTHAAPISQAQRAAGLNSLDAFIPNPDFSERHQRTVQAPAEAAWEAAISVTPAEIRLLAPLMAVRSLPHLLTGRRTKPHDRGTDDVSFLDVFEKEGFLQLHRDTGVADGQAVTIYGAAGRFWSPTGNAPVPLDDAHAFAQHHDARTVKVAFSLQIAGTSTGSVVTTETRIVSADQAARRAFGRYWLIIRGPSGLIRRSWLAAIGRRSRA